MIFYLSCTGNSRWVAEQLAARTGEKMVAMPSLLGSSRLFELQPGERLGFVFPVHGWRPPKLVLEFIDKWMNIKIDGSAHFCYAVCTAGDTVARTIDRLKQQLSLEGIRLHSSFSVIMPESYVGLPFMDVDPSGREKQKIEAAQERVKWISEQIEARTEGITDLTVGPLPSFFSGPVGAFFVNHLITDRPFRVDEARCVRCGRCAQVCPVADIEGGKGLVPQWKHNGRCLTCFSCYHHCPVHAIDYGRRTQHKGQYFYGHKI